MMALIPAALSLIQGQQKKNQVQGPTNIGGIGQQQQQQLPTDFISSILKGFGNQGGSGISGGGQQSIGQGGSLQSGVEQQVGGPGIDQTIGSMLGGQQQPTMLEQIIGQHLQQKQQQQPQQQFDMSQLLGSGGGSNSGSLF